IGRDSPVIASWVVLSRTEVVPETVTPATPTRLTVPDATRAQPPVPSVNSTRPIVALLSRTPTASGLGAPLGRRAGPEPRNTVTPCAPTTRALRSPTVRLVKVSDPVI